jgi:hypothetical protein
MVSSGVKDTRGVSFHQVKDESSLPEYLLEVIIQSRQFIPFVNVANPQEMHTLRGSCRQGEVPNLFAQDGFVRIARFTIFPETQATEDFFRCIAEESL